MTVRDVILGGDPVSVEEKLGSQSAARWDRIAGRIVAVNGKLYFTGALLLFPHHVADDVLSAVDRMARRLKAELRRKPRSKVSRQRSTTTACGNYCFLVRLPVAC